MILDYEVLKVVWWALVGVLLIGFAITDGMDMGVGNLLRVIGKTDEERRVIINTIGPHWDGNQVWLITAGGAIFAAWPAVYAAAFSGFYVAMLLVLFSLFFRPVGFDYRSKVGDEKWRNAWDWGLFAGGAVPSLVFGVAFGNLLQGVPFQLDEHLRPSYIGGFFGLLNPFALVAGVLSFTMLSMQGALWIQLRTEHSIADRAIPWVRITGLVSMAAFAIAGLWLYLGIDGYRIVSMPATDALPNPLAKQMVTEAGAWFSNYSSYPWMIAAPVLGFVGFAAAIVTSASNRPGWGFTFSSLGIAGVIVTAGVAMFPSIMPSSHLTLTVMFWAAVVFVPIVLSYTVWTYYKMWGRVSVEQIRESAHSAY